LLSQLAILMIAMSNQRRTIVRRTIFFVRLLNFWADPLRLT
jgi:hypothetical protein